MIWHHFLRHILANPGDSTVYERNKWLVQLKRANYSDEIKQNLYDRLNSQLDTIALVTTFMSGFAYFIVSGDLTFENDTIPKGAIVVLLAVSFVVGVCSTLLAISVKVCLVEMGPAGMEVFLRKLFWMMPFLASLVILLVTTFIGSGILIIFNRFEIWVGGLIAGLTMLMFLYLGILNLQIKDFALKTLGYGFKGHSYTMPEDCLSLDDSPPQKGQAVPLPIRAFDPAEKA